MGLSDNAICRQYGQEKESSCHTIFQCSALAGHRMKIFGFAWVDLRDTRAIQKVASGELLKNKQ
jgi:hypothetical protein